MTWYNGRHYCNACGHFTRFEYDVNDYITNCGHCGTPIEGLEDRKITVHEAIEMLRRRPNQEQEIDKEGFLKLIGERR